MQTGVAPQHYRSKSVTPRLKRLVAGENISVMEHAAEAEDVVWHAVLRVAWPSRWPGLEASVGREAAQAVVSQQWWPQPGPPLVPSWFCVGPGGRAPGS